MARECFWDAIPEGPGLVIEDRADGGPYPGDDDLDGPWPDISWDAVRITPCTLCRHDETCEFEKCCHRQDWQPPKETEDG